MLLKDILIKVIEEFEGIVGVAVKNLDTGESARAGMVLLPIEYLPRSGT